MPWLVRRTRAALVFLLSCQGKPVIGCCNKPCEDLGVWNIAVAVAAMVIPAMAPESCVAFHGITSGRFGQKPVLLRALA